MTLQSKIKIGDKLRTKKTSFYKYQTLIADGIYSYSLDMIYCITEDGNRSLFFIDELESIE